MRRIRLLRPLVSIDLETTGVELDEARIVEIALVKVTQVRNGPGESIYPIDGKIDGQPLEHTKSFRSLVNPGIPIPAGATAVHGIKDEDVAGAPTFARLAPEIADMLVGLPTHERPDVTGFNVRRFDWPLLAREFARARYPLSLAGFKVVDAFEIFRAREPRGLEDAYKLYCGRPFKRTTHSALDDARAALDVLRGQIAHYEDLPDEPSALAEMFAGDFIDLEGKFRYNEDGEPIVGFGKHKGKPLHTIPGDYLYWIAFKADGFSPDAREIAKQAHIGKYPQRRSTVAKEG